MTKRKWNSGRGVTSYLGGGYGSAPAFTFDSCGNPFFPVAELAGHSADQSWERVDRKLGFGVRCWGARDGLCESQPRL